MRVSPCVPGEPLVPSPDRYGRSPQDLVLGRFAAAVASFLV
ncbi:hypothetical protein [Streptomyces sp. 1268]